MKRTLLSVSLTAGLSLALPLVASAAPPSPRAKAPAARATSKARMVASVEGIQEFVLANGLRVLLFPDPSSAVITVNITYLVGSRHEGYGETGMAHLLEHLLFKGSKLHPKIPQELTQHGARPNGTTWLDRTNYFETFQANQENLEWALSLESDRMVNSFIAKKDLDSEMTVVRNEFEMGENSPSSILGERVVSTSFLWHNYGKSTIGARSDIERVPIDRLQAFYRRYYQPDNAVLVVAGKIDPAQVLARVEHYFGSIPRPTRKLIPTYTEEPVQDGERSVTLRRVGDIQSAMAAYHVPPGSHPDFAAVDVMSEILSDTPSGRLYKALVESGKAVDIGGGAYQLREPGMAVFQANLAKEGNLEEASQVLIQTLEDFPKAPPSEEEVKRAKTTLLKQIEQTLNKSERLALQLSEWAAMGDWRHFFLYRDRLEQVTAADVQRVAQAYLMASNRTLGKFIPTDQPVRAQVPWVGDPAKAVQNYKGRPPIAQGEAFAPTPENCDRRDQRKVLAETIKLAQFPKKTRGNTVNFSMAFRLSNLEFSRGKGAAPGSVASMLMRGSKKHTREQIADELDRLKARASLSSDSNGCTLSIETTRDNLIPTLQLMGEVLREPAWNEKEFGLHKQQLLAGTEEIRNDPESQAGIAMERHLNPYPADDPRHEDSVDEMLESEKKLTLQDIRSFYESTYGASEVEAAVVGDFDSAALEQTLVGLFGGWKSPTRYERIPAQCFQVQPLNQTISIKDKANAVVLGGLNFELRDEHPDYLPLTLGNFMLGGGFLNSRLATRIRQKEGLSYGVGSGFSAGTLDNLAGFNFYAICAPQNVPKVEQAMKEEVQRVLKDGFTEAELKDAKNALLQRREGGRSNDAGLAATLVRYQRVGRRFSWDADLEKRIKSTTNQQIVEALRRHLVWEKVSIVRAGDL